MRTRTAALLGAAALGLAGWQGVAALQRAERPAPETAAPVAARVPAATPPARRSAAPVVPEALSKGDTPMAQRVAVLGVLNKRNGLSRDLTLRPGQAVRLGDLVVRLRACEETAPWEEEHLTGAFVQTDVRGSDARWRRVFSGWLYRESPSLNAVQHPIYDVWPKGCAMRHADTGPETVAAGSAGADAGPDAPRRPRTERRRAAPDADAPETGADTTT